MDDNTLPICAEGDGTERCTDTNHAGCHGFACEDPECRVNGVDRDELFEAEDGSLWCREHFPVPPLVFELHYDDGDVGAYEAVEEDRPMVEHLWRLFSHSDGSKASHIIVRKEGDEYADPASKVLQELLDADFIPWEYQAAARKALGLPKEDEDDSEE